MMNEDRDGEHVKEVYARFGLAVYYAQVLEHGLVNALLVLDLLPSRRHLARSRAEWEAAVGNFMGRHFEGTMGQLMKSLRVVTAVPSDLEALLHEALERRNRLVHDFFRERAADFMSTRGREDMLREVDECRSSFEAADSRLAEIIRPLRLKAGVTDELVAAEYRLMKGSGRHDG